MEKPVKLFSMIFLKSYLITMRPYLLFVSGAASIAGLSTLHDLPQLKAVLTFCVFFLSYGFGQALTDCFQIDTDEISSPYRPLTQGVITKNQVMAISVVCLLILCIILYFMNPLIFIPALLSVTGLATYSFFKKIWWAGPFYNSWIVALIPIMSRMIAPDEPLIIPLMVPVLASVFFSYASFVLIGYFKDISADRKTGYNTFPVKFGWVPGCVVSDIFVGISIAASAGTLFLVYSKNPGLFLFLMAILFYIAGVYFGILGLVQLHSTRSENHAYRPIVNTVRMYMLLLLAQSCHVSNLFLFIAVAFYAAFEIALKHRPERTQV